MILVFVEIKRLTVNYLSELSKKGLNYLSELSKNSKFYLSELSNFLIFVSDYQVLFAMHEYIQRKHRRSCLFEYFGEFSYTDPQADNAVRHITIVPLYALENLRSSQTLNREKYSLVMDYCKANQ